jgi:hypothetical protein
MDEGRIPRLYFITRTFIHRRNSGAYYRGLFSAHTIISAVRPKVYETKQESGSKAK